VRRGAQPPAHYEVELRQADQDGRGGTGWRAIKRVLPNGMVAPLKFGSVQAAQTHAGRLSGRETRIVAVERDGWRRTVDADEA
jgi:hypothetical protein